MASEKEGSDIGSSSSTGTSSETTTDEEATDAKEERNKLCMCILLVSVSL